MVDFRRKHKTIFLVIDIGNGRIKIVRSNGESIIIPSYIKYLKESEAQVALSALRSDAVKYIEGSNGKLKKKIWVVGDSAIAETRHERVIKDNFNKADMALPFLLSALALYGCLTEEETNVVVVATCHDFDGVGKRLKAGLEGWHRIEHDGQERVVKIHLPKVGVIEEGSAIGKAGNFVDFCTIDFGRKTVIYKFWKNGRVVYSLYSERGVEDLLLDIAKRMSSLIGGIGDVTLIDRALQNAVIGEREKKVVKRDEEGKKVTDADGKAVKETVKVRCVNEVNYTHKGKKINIANLYIECLSDWIDYAMEQGVNAYYDQADGLPFFGIGGGVNLPLMDESLEANGITIYTGDTTFANAQTAYDYVLKPQLKDYDDDFSEIFDAIKEPTDGTQSTVNAPEGEKPTESTDSTGDVTVLEVA